VIVLELFNTPAKTTAHHTIINAYRRPSSSTTEFIANLQVAIDQIYTRNPTTHITVQGDLNIDILKPLTQDFKDLLLENSLHTTITTPTRYDPVHADTATLIDCTLTTLTDTDTTAGTISPPISDHLPTCTIFHKAANRKQQTQKTLTTAAYSRHKTKIIADLEANITNKITSMRQAATTSEIFHNIQAAINQTVEQHETLPKQRKNHWITPRYKRKIQKQHNLHQKRIQNPTSANIAKHSQYRKKLAKLIQKEKKQSLTAKLDAAKGDPKQQHKILSTVIPKKSTTRSTPTKLVYEGRTLTNSQHIADALNDHYITIGHKTAVAIPQDDDSIRDDRPTSLSPSFTLQHTTEEIVTKKLKQINSNKGQRHLQGQASHPEGSRSLSRTNPNNTHQPSYRRERVPRLSQTDESDRTVQIERQNPACELPTDLSPPHHRQAPRHHHQRAAHAPPHQTQHHLPDSIRLQTKLQLHARAANHHRQHHKEQGPAQAHAGDLHRSVESVRHRLTPETNQ
jgi:hypothetical protein